MKKGMTFLSVVLGVIMLLATIAGANAVDSFLIQSNAANGAGGITNEIAQTFIAPITGTLSACFRTNVPSSAPQNWSLYNATGTNGTQVPVFSEKIEEYQLSFTVDETYQCTNFTTVLTSGKQYGYGVVIANAGVHGEWGFLVTVDPYANGTYTTRDLSGTTWAGNTAGHDMAFQFNFTSVAVPAGNNFTITATDNVSGLGLSSYNATLTQGATSLFFSTTTSPLQANVTNGTYNVTVRAYTYEPLTYLNVNTSLGLGANLTKFWYSNLSGVASTSTEFDGQNLTLRVNITSSVTNVNASFTFNGTSYIPTKSQNSTHAIFTASFLSPAVTSATSLSYTWFINISAGGTFYDNKTATQTINAINGTLFNSSSTVTGENQTINFTINTTTNASVVYASLTWNSALIGLQSRTNNTNNVTFVWNVLTPIVADGTNISGTINYNITSTESVITTHSRSMTQLVVAFNFDNCTINTVRALNITVYNETSNTIVANATINAYFRAWLGNPSAYREFNLSWNGNTTYSVCIAPSTRTYDVYAQMIYGATNFQNEQHYLNNVTFNSTTQQLRLYLTDNPTSVILNVVDQNGNDVSGVYIYVQKYDPATNSYINTETVLTGFDGNAISQLQVLTTWYRFILVYNGETVLTTSPFKITSTTQTFTINLVDDYFDAYDQVQNILCHITFTNSTRNFAMTYVDTGGVSTNTCLAVTRTVGASTTTYNTTCQTGTSGTILIGIPASTGSGTYTGKGTVSISGSTFVCGTPASNNDSTSWRLFGDAGLYLSWLFLVFCFMLGLWNPIAGAVLMIVGLIGLNMIGLLYLSWPILIANIIILGLFAYRLKQR